MEHVADNENDYCDRVQTPSTPHVGLPSWFSVRNATTEDLPNHSSVTGASRLKAGCQALVHSRLRCFAGCISMRTNAVTEQSMVHAILGVSHRIARPMSQGHLPLRLHTSSHRLTRPPRHRRRGVCPHTHCPQTHTSTVFSVVLTIVAREMTVALGPPTDHMETFCGHTPRTLARPSARLIARDWATTTQTANFSHEPFIHSLASG